MIADLSFSCELILIKNNTMHIMIMFNVVVTTFNAYISYSLFDFTIQLNRTKINQIPVDTAQLNFHPKHMVINFTSPQVTPHEAPIVAIKNKTTTTTDDVSLFFFKAILSYQSFKNLFRKIFFWLKRKPAISIVL